MPLATGNRGSSSVAELFELASRRDLGPIGTASRDHPEIGELDLECDCAAANSQSLAVRPHLVNNLAKRIPRGLVGEEIGRKRVLGADRFVDPIGADGALVDAAQPNSSRSRASRNTAAGRPAIAP